MPYPQIHPGGAIRDANDTGSILTTPTTLRSSSFGWQATRRSFRAGSGSRSTLVRRDACWGGTHICMWYVYFLRLSNGDIYVGSTNDIERRVKSHTSGQVTSTKAYLPATLKSFVAIETERHARELEAYFKTGSGKAVATKRFIRD